MSKPFSGHFFGTIGFKEINFAKVYHNNIIKNDRDFLKLDLREHPTPYKQLGNKNRKALNEKVKNRTITKNEYKRLMWDKRFSKRRKKGVKNFWDYETSRLLAGYPGTRNWSAAQANDIINGKRPKYKGKTMQGHHTFSAAKYPHLADRREVIYPVTQHEHLYGWHGGNYRNSLPGKPYKNIKDF